MKIAIIDYGSGNLRSATKAFERAARENDLDAEIVLTDRAEQVAAADKVVLPGVGAYRDCAHGLAAVDGMIEALNDAVTAKGRPFLGICVGMQLMSTRGLEKIPTEGFDWIPGDVVEMVPENPDLKIPQIGWNTIRLANSHPLFQDIPTGDGGLHAYFVHSYHLEPKSPDHIVAETDYGGSVTAAVARDNLIGTQFHPEKSQKLGLTLIANFLKWSPL